MASSNSTEITFIIDSDEGADRHKYVARFNENSIGEGACRAAYRGRIVSSTPPGGPRVGLECVVKIFKDDYARHYDQWVPDLKAHKRAAKMAKEFNKLDLKATPKCTIEVLTPMIAKVETVGGFHGNTYVSLEPYLEGHWQKFNNNDDWCDEREPLMQAFSHWTGCKSGFKYLLCDLQGVKRGNVYMITDPAIHSGEGDGIHGPTDCGVVGMEQFFSGHRCNSICQQLGLSENRIPYSPSSKAGSVFSFQLTMEQKRQNAQKRGKYINPMECIAEMDF